jgi:antitoxin component of MazEF toxin-antitoxin module
MEADMIKATVIRPIGKSSGVVIPKAMLANLGVREGDILLAVELEDGILLTARNSASGKAMEAFRDGMRRYRMR